MTLSAWLSLALVCLLGAMSPGPSLAIVVRHSVTSGTRAGVICAFSHGFGIFLWAALMVSGLGALLLAQPTWFDGLRALGAGFLLYLGCRALAAQRAGHVRRPTFGEQQGLDGIRVEDLVETIEAMDSPRHTTRVRLGIDPAPVESALQGANQGRDIGLGPGPAEATDVLLLAPLVFRFGLGDSTPVFDRADWPKLGGHLVELAKAITTLPDAIASGQGIDMATRQKLQQHNTPLAGFAVGAAQELGGTGPNGAFTHPAVMANLMRAALEAAGQPLTPEQERF